MQASQGKSGGPAQNRTGVNGFAIRETAQIAVPTGTVGQAASHESAVVSGEFADGDSEGDEGHGVAARVATRFPCITEADLFCGYGVEEVRP